VALSLCAVPRRGYLKSASKEIPSSQSKAQSSSARESWALSVLHIGLVGPTSFAFCYIAILFSTCCIHSKRTRSALNQSCRLTTRADRLPLIAFTHHHSLRTVQICQTIHGHSTRHFAMCKTSWPILQNGTNPFGLTHHLPLGDHFRHFHTRAAL
jgi:hypothetical protein